MYPISCIKFSGVFPTLLSCSLALGERAKEEKKGFSGETPKPPTGGLQPSCTTRKRRYHSVDAYGRHPRALGGRAVALLRLEKRILYAGMLIILHV